MSQNDGINKLRLALKVFAFFYLFYGVGFMVIPGILVSMSGEPDVHLGWIRWAGGPLLALGLGAIQVHRKPAGQDSFIITAILSSLLVGLGLLYSKIFDLSAVYTWFHMTPCVVNLALFALLLWARQGAKEVLE
jgi:hypothetical protein